MHDQQRLIMAHSIRTRTFLSASCFRSATPASQASSSWTSRFLSRLLRASDFDRGESPQGETSYVYPPTYLPTCLYNTTQSHFVSPASISRTELRRYLNKSFYCAGANRLVFQVPPYFRRNPLPPDLVNRTMLEIEKKHVIPILMSLLA